MAHDRLAQALVDAVGEISGERDALVAVSNVGCGRDTLADAIRDAVAGRPAVVFVDLPSGSCLQATAAYVRSRPDIAVVAGVNLAMLLDFLYHRDGTPAQAAARALQTGGRSIRLWPS